MSGASVFGEENLEKIEKFVTNTNFKKILVMHLPKKRQEFSRLFGDLFDKALAREAEELAAKEAAELAARGGIQKESKPKVEKFSVVGVSKISDKVRLDREKFKKIKEAAKQEAVVEVKVAQNPTGNSQPVPSGNPGPVDDDDDSIDEI
jgi:hypothetical protein